MTGRRPGARACERGCASPERQACQVRGEIHIKWFDVLKANRWAEGKGGCGAQGHGCVNKRGNAASLPPSRLAGAAPAVLSLLSFASFLSNLPYLSVAALLGLGDESGREEGGNKNHFVFGKASPVPCSKINTFLVLSVLPPRGWIILALKGLHCATNLCSVKQRVHAKKQDRPDCLHRVFSVETFRSELRKTKQKPVLPCDLADSFLQCMFLSSPFNL